MKKRFPRFDMTELNKSMKDHVFYPVIKKELYREWRDKLSDETIDYIKSGKQIDETTYDNMRGNSYDWKTRYPMLSDETLIKAIEYNMDNCTSISHHGRYRVDVTYEEALINTLLPVLLDRFEELTPKPEKFDRMDCGEVLEIVAKAKGVDPARLFIRLEDDVFFIEKHNDEGDK